MGEQQGLVDIVVGVAIHGEGGGPYLLFSADGYQGSWSIILMVVVAIDGFMSRWIVGCLFVTLGAPPRNLALQGKEHVQVQVSYIMLMLGR